MGARLVAGVLVLWISAAPLPLAWSQHEGPTDLARGIRQIEEGDLEAAVVTLDDVVRALAGRPGQEKHLSQAHLYLGMAHVGLGQIEKGRLHLADAWRHDKGLDLDPKRFPPRVVQLYEQARAEAKTASGTTSPPDHRSKTGAAPKEKGGSKLPLVLIGVAAVGAGGAALALAGGGPTTSCSGGGQVAVEDSSTSSDDDQFQVSLDGKVLGTTGVPTSPLSALPPLLICKIPGGGHTLGVTCVNDGSGGAGICSSQVTLSQGVTFSDGRLSPSRESMRQGETRTYPITVP